LTLLLVFLAGGAAGIAAYRYLKPSVTVRSLSQTWSKEGRAFTMNKLRQELDLSEEQAQEIQAVLDDFMRYYQSLQVQMDDVRAQGKAAIMQVLNPEQRIKFEHLGKELP
jgi:Spy/CpxP family protein refolding chaperone